MKYKPGPVPAGLPASARDYLARELSRIAQALEGIDNLSLAEKGAEPDKYNDGDVVYADGVSWDPGSGEGLYGRYNSTWNALGGGGGGGGLDGTADEDITGQWDFEDDLRLRGGGDLYIYDTGNTDYGRFHHNGTDFNSDFTNTTDWNINGLSHIRWPSSCRHWFNSRIYFRNCDDFYILRTTTNGIRILPSAGAVNINAIGTADSLLYNDWNDVQFYDGTQVRFRGATGGYFEFTHDSTDANINTNSTTDLNISFLTGNVVLKDGAGLQINNSLENDYAIFSHDGIDFNTGFTNTADWNIDSLSGNILVDGDYVPVSSGTTGGTGSAGSGNEYVELEINGTIYKVLHDGTV